jgi:hypothetical protein
VRLGRHDDERLCAIATIAGHSVGHKQRRTKSGEIGRGPVKEGTTRADRALAGPPWDTGMSPLPQLSALICLHFRAIDSDADYPAMDLRE